MHSITKSIIILTCSLLMYSENCMGENFEIYETLTYSDNNTEVVKTQEVDFGKTATLVCRSNDKYHLFLFWELPKDDIVVGPGNNYDQYKYDFEILTGNLIIHEVSNDEEGLYQCVSRGVKNENINIRSVRMSLKQDWAALEVHDPGLNYFRGVVVVASLIIIAGLIYFAYRLRRRHRLQSLLDAESDEEDSAEEIFRAPGTSRDADRDTHIVIDKVEDLEIPKISIDFEDILKNSNIK